MNRFQIALPLALFVAGCASDTETTKTHEAPPAETPAAPPAPEAKEPLSLAELEGTWERDDARRYQFVVSQGQLIGYSTEQGEYSCRVRLALSGESLEGPATFTRGKDEAGLLSTTWSLRVEDPETLRGVVGAWDLDPDSGEVLSEGTETHTFSLHERFSPERARDCRAVAEVHLLIDEVLAAGADDESVATLFRANALRDLASNPLRDSAGGRLEAILLQAGVPALSEPTTLAASSASPADEADETATKAAPSPGHELEMQAFLAEIKGQAEEVEGALAQFGVEGLDGKDMDYYDLFEPTVTAHEGDRFVFEAKAGITLRTYGVTWAEGKIVEIEDMGMR